MTTKEEMEAVNEEIQERTKQVMNTGSAASNADTASAHLHGAIQRLDKLEENELKKDLEEAQALVDKVSDKLRFKKKKVDEELAAAKDKKQEIGRQEELQEIKTEAEEKLDKILEQEKKTGDKEE